MVDAQHTFKESGGDGLERSKGPGCGGVMPTSELGFYPTVIRETLEILYSSVCEINLTAMENEFE